MLFIERVLVFYGLLKIFTDKQLKLKLFNKIVKYNTTKIYALILFLTILHLEYVLIIGIIKIKRNYKKKELYQNKLNESKIKTLFTLILINM